ncbi:FecCD family ABC transporter permease [Actinomycetospora callitridis]|uniref:FecCD family ABC transporter permease n=1 Tax=Actinomycetospora callitridis TaxID=913944 RepID=UPI0023667D4E|nr:iron chelate uptake ABC transporter family permease subunit [Actinomycetospora callitridis]MDD7916730.1 iron chelate uptake ABC transporter family permease subunit [Actinomycetospora callitridis]
MSAPPRPRPAPPVTGRLVRLAGGRVTLRVGPRSVAVGVVSLLVVVVGAVVSLTTGEAPLSLVEVGETLVGQGSRSTEFVVLTLRLPRLLLAIGVGAALAVSGAVLQSLSRNVLGSPDVIGFTTGAATGALVAIVVLGATTLGTSVGALIGGVVTALVVVGLAAGRGTQGLRLVLIGIGVGAMLLAVNSWLITRAALQTAVDAQAWLLGDLSNRGWTQVVALAVALVLLLPIVLAGARRLALLELGDRPAGGLGVDVTRTRNVALLAAVGLAAAATAAAGPIPFLALAAPQIARRLSRSATPVLVPSALLGAAMLVVSDLAVTRLFAPVPLPVGVATGLLGGLYLIALLVRMWRGSTT